MSAPSPRASARMRRISGGHILEGLGRVLVADPDPQLLREIQLKFQQRGIVCKTCTTGEDAVNHALDSQTDFFIVTADLPGMDGYELTRRLRTQSATSQCGVIMLNSKDDDEFRRKAYELGVVGCEAKPCDLDELVLRSQSMLNLQASRRKHSQASTDELKRREEIMYRVIHDILSPISGIRGAAELLAGDDYPAELRKELGTALLGGLDQLLAGLQDLNRYFRLQTGRSKLEMIPLDLQNVARKVIASRQTDAEKKGSHIEFDAPEGEINVLGDPVALTQIFSELLTNAIKFSPPGATIWARLTRPAPCPRALGSDAEQLWVRLEVDDRGPGLSEEEQRKLFQEFTRLTPQPTGGERGMGMGLCIAQRLATLQNGRIEVDSQRARGSKFTLVFPARVPKV